MLFEINKHPKNNYNFWGALLYAVYNYKIVFAQIVNQYLLFCRNITVLCYVLNKGKACIV